jgi:acetyl-CoA C-acetyltransferase
MAEAIAAALGDLPAGVDPGAVAAAVDHLACVDPLAWGYTELCEVTASHAGLPAGVTGLTVPPGGNSPGDLLGRLANLVAEGSCTVAVLAGSEAVYGRRRARKEGITLEWTPFEGHRDFVKGQRPITNELEQRHGLTQPSQCYPLFEIAQRAAARRTPAEHERFLGELMARNSAAAAGNPYAWFPVAYTPQEITTVGPDNRMISFPYPKRMNAIMEVDLAAAVVVMSNLEADRLGIPRRQQVAFLGGASAVDAWTPTERPSLTSSPALRAAAAAALGEARLTTSEIDRFDLYSCFPSAVQMGAEAIGVAPDDPRGLSITGGLAYAGGPGNSYALHSLAAATSLLRTGAARTALVTALGMTSTKHAVAILSTEAELVARAGHHHHKVAMPEADVTGPALADAPSGPGTVETYTVEYGRDGEAVRTVYVVRMADGTRTVANGACTAEEVELLTTTEAVGAPVQVTGGVRDDTGSLGPNLAVLSATAHGVAA